MTEPTSAQDLFKGRHFDQEIIVLSVRWYLAFKLSSRDLVQMMAERGITLSHTTILRWVQLRAQRRKQIYRDGGAGGLFWSAPISQLVTVAFQICDIFA